MENDTTRVATLTGAGLIEHTAKLDRDIELATALLYDDILPKMLAHILNKGYTPKSIELASLLLLSAAVGEEPRP